MSEYINAIYRVNAYCEEIGTAPAYILSNSMEIGYREYLFGFSEILDYYKTNNKSVIKMELMKIILRGMFPNI